MAGCGRMNEVESAAADTEWRQPWERERPSGLVAGRRRGAAAAAIGGALSSSASAMAAAAEFAHL